MERSKYNQIIIRIKIIITINPIFYTLNLNTIINNSKNKKKSDYADF